MASYDSQKKVVESDRWRGALGSKRLGLPSRRAQRRESGCACYYELQRALTTIVEVNRMRQRETHYETVVIAMGVPVDKVSTHGV